MIIQHNISALNTYRQMSINNSGSAKALEKLSSGYKINRAGDDAAGLAISEKMRAQINGLNRASANAQDGVSLIQAAEGALQETHSILQRMRELAVQAANDVNETEDRQAIQDELNQLTKEVDRIAFTTEFNKKTLLDGSLTNGKYIRSLTGSNVSSIAFLSQSDPSGDPVPLVNGLTTVSVSEAGAKFEMTYDFALSLDDSPDGLVSAEQAADGAANVTITLSDDMKVSAGLSEDASSEYIVAVNEGDTASIIAGNVRDTLAEALGADWTITATGSQVKIEHKYVGQFGEDFAMEIGAPVISEDAQGTLGKNAIISVNGEVATFANENGMFSDELQAGELKGRDASLQLLLGEGVVGETHAEQFSFKIDDATKLSTAIIGTADGSDLTLQVGANTGYDQTIKIAVEALSAKAMGIAELNVSTHLDSQNALAAVEGAIQQVSDQRAGLGAVQNRLEHTSANLDTVAENLQAAESRVRDVDMAKEMMNFTKYNILMQASQAMMAQANSQPQGVLQLLG